MPHLDVISVSTRREKKQFFQLPWDLYRGNPNWVPPLRMVQQELLNYRPHPFYDDAEIQTFLALRDGRPCGRLAAIVNHAHNRWYNEKRGFFGFFESIDDDEVAGRLFDEAKSWFAQREIEAIRGPVNPSLNYECALLVDGFEEPPWFMMPYNLPYYDRLIRACGFRKAQDMVAFWGHIDMLKSLSEKLRMMSQVVEERFNLKCRRFNLKQFKKEITTFQSLYNSSLVSTWGFVPLSDAEVRKQAAGMKQMIAPELTTMAEIEGKPVGAMLALLDYNPRIQKIDGRLFPFGFLKLLRNKRKIHRVRLLSTNVLPEYQSWGIGISLVGRLVPEALEWGITEAEFSWVLESNHLSYKTLKKGGAKITKRYRIYDYGPPDTTANAKYMEQESP
ncbi:MAG: N-acetyltransferase [Pirellulales bacterium]